MSPSKTPNDEWYSAELVDESGLPDIGLVSHDEADVGPPGSAVVLDHEPVIIDPGEAATGSSSVRRAPGPEGELTLSDITTLSDNAGSTPKTDPLLALEEGKEKVEAHEHRLQAWILLGIGLAFLLIVVAYVAGLAANWLDAETADKLLQTALPPILSAAAVAVGYAFGSRRR